MKFWQFHLSAKFENFPNFFLWWRHLDAASNRKQYLHHLIVLKKSWKINLIIWSINNFQDLIIEMAVLDPAVKSKKYLWNRTFGWNFCVLGAGNLLNFFLKILKNFPSGSLIHREGQGRFYVWVNCPEKMIKNAGKIIFLS